jgi:hypothetical protein
MALTKAPYTLGSHAFFFPDGATWTASGGGTSSRTAKPPAADAAWINLGIVVGATESPIESEKIDIFAPTPGVLRKYDVVETKRQRKGKLKVKELSPLALQILYRTLALTESSTQYNTLEGKLVKGWLKVQRYDQNDSIRITEDLFVVLEVVSDVEMGGDGLAEVEFEYDVLHSTLNTGTL